MAFQMFQNQASPIAIDFGTASVKLLQVGAAEKPVVAGAAELPIPDSIRGDTEKLMAFYAEYLPDLLNKAKFKGRRAVMAVPSTKTHIQHMQLAAVEGTTVDSLAKAQLQMQLGISPDAMEVRCEEVCDIHRDGQAMKEILCFAIARDTVMRHIELLKRLKVTVVGVHTEIRALAFAFDHLARRQADESITTMILDIGWGGTKVAITHGKKVAFARYVAVGGRQFDQCMSGDLHCDIVAARKHRLEIGPNAKRQAGVASTTPARNALLSVAGIADSGESSSYDGPDRRGNAPRELATALKPGTGTVGIGFDPVFEQIVDELAMCARYHLARFPDRPIDRVICVGGESRQLWIGQRLANDLGLGALLGDPITRLAFDASTPTAGVDLNEPQPGWSIACGLCTAPTDL